MVQIAGWHSTKDIPQFETLTTYLLRVMLKTLLLKNSSVPFSIGSINTNNNLKF